MATKAVELKLDCGHWSQPMNHPEAHEAIGTAATVPCRKWDCDGGRYDGGRVMVGGRARDSLDSPPKPARPPVRRHDGLCFRTYADTHIKWWCRFCHGNNPTGRASVRSEDDLWEQWDQHKVGSRHLEQVHNIRLAEQVARAIDPNRV
jgi:hypothetical protein